MNKVLCILDKESGKLEELSGIDLLNGFSGLKKITILEASEKYLKECTAFKSIPSQRIEKKYFPIFLNHLETFKLNYLHEITVEHIDSFQNELLKKMSPQSVRKRLSTFKHFFNKCINWNYLYKSPFVGMRVVKFEKNQRKNWTAEIYKDFLELTCSNTRGLFQFLWHTGCRPTELINLKWTDIDLDRKTIMFRCGKNSHISRLFPIYDEVEKIIHNLKMNGNTVFSISEKPLTNDTLSHYARKRLKRLGIKDLVVYGIRHSFPTRLSEAGFNAFEIKELMGHSDIRTTLNYMHHDKKVLIQKLNNVKSS